MELWEPAHWLSVSPWPRAGSTSYRPEKCLYDVRIHSTNISCGQGISEMLCGEQTPTTQPFHYEICNKLSSLINDSIEIAAYAIMVERKIFSQIHQEIRTDLKEEVARTHYCVLGGAFAVDHSQVSG